MDKNAIKKYAVWARRELISRISQRAAIYGITENDCGDPRADSVHGQVLTPTEKKQRQALIMRVNHKGYQTVMEEVAYTWFNRFSALRFMEVNGYLPSRVRVFTDDSNAFKPQILSEAINLELDGLDMEKVYALKNGNQDDELFKNLVITQCNALSAILPGMFQKIEDFTELLFPDNLLRDGSVVEQMVALIPEEDWKDQVQIIGWLYQYYNSEKKDDVFAALKKNVKITKENIPAATQLFTPDWIVRYMVENSLGRVVINNLKYDVWSDEEKTKIEQFKEKWRYYIDDAEQTPEVEAELRAMEHNKYGSGEVEPFIDTTFIDPCMGSGHILVYAFDVFMDIYLAQGWSSRDAARRIVEKNLYGLDIDDRAAQLAYFSVMMKGRQYDGRFFKRGVQPHVYAIQESNEIRYDEEFGEFLLEEQHRDTLRYLLEVFRDAKEYGSILKVEPRDYLGFLNAWELSAEATLENVMMIGWYTGAKDTVTALAWQAHLLSQTYNVVATNPPYMGASGMSPKLSDFVKMDYPATKSDMSTVCMEQAIGMCSDYMAMINIPVWMFLSSYEKLRKNLIANNTFINMVHPGRGIFGSDFGTTTFVIGKGHISGYQGTYHRLFEKQVEVETIELREQRFFEGRGKFISQQENFSKIPGSPVAYWASQLIFEAFGKGIALEDIAHPRKGLATTDNNRFLRFWYEISSTLFGIGCKTKEQAQSSGKKWFPLNKGGEFRRWYGNKFYVVNWYNDGQEMKEAVIKRYNGGSYSKEIRSEDRYFQNSITWSALTSGMSSFRYSDYGALFDSAGSSMFPEENSFYLLALLNTKVTESILKIINPTLNYGAGSIAIIPVLLMANLKSEIESIVASCVQMSHEDWDAFETSWDFEQHPIVRKALSRFHWNDDGPTTIEYVYKYVAQDFEDRFQRLKANEEELNRIFIDIYGLQSELTPEVEEKDVTVRRADLGRDIRSLISYAVGCMFGRYDLGRPGLAYAGGEWDAERYSLFPADKDNVIPVCDDEYFEDDILGRFVEFVRVVFGDETLDENLKYIADALGGKGQPKDVIRNYFMNGFYSDHLKLYQKRPIYWMFDSGKKNGFKCLIYMHRYQPDTIARIRTDYVHEQQSRYRTAIADLEKRMENAATGERVKLSKQLKKLQEQAEEIRVYEEEIHHLADQMISIDLDDGVKVNYAKLQDVLAKIK